MAQYKGLIEDDTRRTFAAMVLALDDGVKNVTEALERRNMSANTLIIFSTDNGGLGTPSQIPLAVGGNNYPLRGAKGTLWEGGIRGE